MFELRNGRECFFQWDLDQQLIVSDPSITEVHFCNKTDDCSLVCKVYEEDGLRLVNVPNILLQTDWSIRVYAYCTNYTKQEKIFKVCPRTKPADYVYTETEVATWDKLEQRMDELESTVTAEGIENAVTEYLKENPVEAGATAEEAAQIAQNTADIKALQEKEIDLSDYALKSDIPDVSGFITAIPAEYITETELEGKGYLTEHQSLEGYALKSDIPDVEGFLTEIPAEYVTDTELNAKGYLTEHQSLEGYALKTELPDVSGFVTEEQVIALIEEHGGGGSLPASEEVEF